MDLLDRNRLICLELESAHGHRLVGAKLVLVIGTGNIGGNSTVHFLGAEVMLYYVKGLLVNFHVLVRLEILNFIQTIAFLY